MVDFKLPGVRSDRIDAFESFRRCRVLDTRRSVDKAVSRFSSSGEDSLTELVYPCPVPDTSDKVPLAGVGMIPDLVARRDEEESLRRGAGGTLSVDRLLRCREDRLLRRVDGAGGLREVI